jgi:hypothetical protein
MPTDSEAAHIDQISLDIYCFILIIILLKILEGLEYLGGGVKYGRELIQLHKYSMIVLTIFYEAKKGYLFASDLLAIPYYMESELLPP